MYTGGILVRAALRELYALGVTGHDVLFSAVTNTEPLAWQLPPILPMGTVGGIVPTVYRNPRLYQLDAAKLWKLYSEHMAEPLDEWNYSPTKGFVLVHQMFNGVLGAEAKLMFSEPQQDDPLAGAVFSLELATVLRRAAMGSFRGSDTDYYVTLGPYSFGIKDGLPIAGSDVWTANLGKYVRAQLAMPRGKVYTFKQFNVLDRIAFWAMENSHVIPDLETFIGALAPLRIYGKPEEVLRVEQDLYAVPEVKPGFTSEQKRNQLARQQREAWQEAKSIYSNWSMNDKQRLEHIYDLMVPLLCTSTEFRKKLGNVTRQKIIMNAAELERFQNGMNYFEGIYK